MVDQLSSFTNRTPNTITRTALRNESGLTRRRGSTRCDHFPASVRPSHTRPDCPVFALDANANSDAEQERRGSYGLNRAITSWRARITPVRTQNAAADTGRKNRMMTCRCRMNILVEYGPRHAQRVSHVSATAMPMTIGRFRVEASTEGRLPALALRRKCDRRCRTTIASRQFGAGHRVRGFRRAEGSGSCRFNRNLTVEAPESRWLSTSIRRRLGCAVRSGRRSPKSRMARSLSPSTHKTSSMSCQSSVGPVWGLTICRVLQWYAMHSGSSACL